MWGEGVTVTWGELEVAEKKIKDVHERIKIIRTICEINLIKVMV